MSEFDPRITAYFGDAVLHAGFVAVPHLFLRHYRQIGLSSNQAMFLLQVMESTWDLAAPPRTTGDLAKRMGVDKRTIRKYSEEIVDLGLLVLYDQFDANGAQIENGYDLSPLFARLAELAPEPTPQGSVARRMPRARRGDGSGSAEQTITPPGTLNPPPPGTHDPPGMEAAIRPVPDRLIPGDRIDRSGLKMNPRIPKNQAACLMHDHQLSSARPLRQAPESQSGWSLRQQRPLSAGEVAESERVLQRIGIDLPVRALLAPTLAPSEAWALWLYGLSKRWRVPLIIAQVYDRQHKRPRPALDLPDALDHIGQVLASADQQIAERIVRTIAQHGRDALEQLTDLDIWHEIAPLWSACATALWPDQVPVMPRMARSVSADGHEVADGWQSVWQRVQGDLKSRLPFAEYESWIHDTALLDLDECRAVVGTANVFARDTIAACYQEPIEQTLSAHLGRRVAVTVVIDR